MSDLADVLGETPKAKPAAKKAASAAKPKAAPAAKPNGKTAAAPAKKTTPKVKPADDVSTTQPDDKVTLAAVRKLKEPTLASKLAMVMGVHRRVIRAQLQRLAKDKANGVKMVKDGFNWFVSTK